MKKWLEYLVSKLFSNRKCRGFSPWLGRLWLLWLTVNQGARGSGISSELVLMATPEHGSSPVGAQQREGNTGFGRRWRDGATEAMNGGA
jgi:hypothetical protein